MPSFTSPTKSTDKYIPNSNPWRFGWPNSADMNFNFYKLLDDAKSTSIGKVSGTPPKIAIIGAGVAGVTSARELFRSGYTNIDIYEATDRIGGRDYSAETMGRYQYLPPKSVYELGAMRFPFFPDPTAPNSAMGFYAGSYGITTQNFPDPGVVTTGIYSNDGYGPDTSKPYPNPTMLIWEAGTQPPDPFLLDIFNKWEAFSNLVKGVFSPAYVKGDESWVPLWHDVANHYAYLNFRQMARLPAISSYDPSKPGYFGGLGLTDEQLQIFYLIGAGDGSWGAFFDVGALYILRTLLCGFGDNHQQVKGRFNSDEFNPGPYYGAGEVPVSDGGTIQSPIYKGIQSIAECMFFLPANSAGESLYDAVSGKVSGADVNFFSNTPIVSIGGESGSTTTSLSYFEINENLITKDYDHVILTPTTWASQLSMDMTRLHADRLPYQVRSAMGTAHWIKSCKICLTAKEKYWENNLSKIPQVLITDTYLQDVYAYSSDEYVGVVILSYTWEDDASKFLSYSDEELVATCLNEADSILLRSTNIGQQLSDYVSTEEARVIHWALMPTYHGCANLYREGRWKEDYTLLAFNQTYSDTARIYFAGEAYSVEGGWTEPAMRSALDAVVHVIKNSGGEFLNDFDFETDYLTLDTSFIPSQ